MQETPRARALGPQVRIALNQVQALLRRDESFDPKSVTRLFKVALPDSVEVLLGPQLLAALQAEAPGVSLLLEPFDRVSLPGELDADRIDLGIGFRLSGQVHHKQRLLFRDNFLCLFNGALLGVEAPIGMRDFLRFPHVLTSLSGIARGVVDDALAKEGLSRTVVLWTPRFLAVPTLVQGAPVITTMSARLAELYAKTLGLTLSPAPVPLEDIPVSMMWHASYDADPAHRWLRELLVRLCREL